MRTELCHLNWKQLNEHGNSIEMTGNCVLSVSMQCMNGENPLDFHSDF